MLPPETKEVAGGDAAVKKAIEELGPMKVSEKKLLIIAITLLFFWVTEKVLHPIDTTTSTVIAVTIMFLPGIGIMTWKQAQEKISWGTLVLFGIGISLGSALLSTKAAAWLANQIVLGFGLASLSVFAVFAILAMNIFITTTRESS